VCHLDDKPAVDRMRRIRSVDERHHLTLLCRDLSELSSYAKVDNAMYRMLRLGTPGPYTFILEATREVPRRLSHPSRKTIGIRVPAHPAAQGLLDVLGQPLIGTTLQLPGDELPLADPADIRARLEHDIDLVLDAGACGIEPTTVIDLTGREAVVIRAGRGPLSAIGLG
jgi:tRNA threonylcarbamoyl adenosine modification protein (Sua5/YciO/YrdC/YwlC family)